MAADRLPSRFGMLRAAPVLLAVPFITALDLRPAQALWGWPQGPWCAYMAEGSGTDCGFYSFEQCRATISGVGGYCSPNPNFVAPPVERRYRTRRPY